MDKIWDRKSFEVCGHWPLWRGWKKRMTTQSRQKSNAKKDNNMKIAVKYIEGRLKISVSQKNNQVYQVNIFDGKLDCDLARQLVKKCWYRERTREVIIQANHLSVSIHVDKRFQDVTTLSIILLFPLHT